MSTTSHVRELKYPWRRSKPILFSPLFLNVLFCYKPIKVPTSSASDAISSLHPCPTVSEQPQSKWKINHTFIIYFYYYSGPVPKCRTSNPTQSHSLWICPDWTSCQCEHHLHAGWGRSLWSICHQQRTFLTLTLLKQWSFPGWPGSWSVCIMHSSVALLILVLIDWCIFFSTPWQVSFKDHYSMHNLPWRLMRRKKLIRNGWELALWQGSICCERNPVSSSAGVCVCSSLFRFLNVSP